jgi:hypothetical protein
MFIYLVKMTIYFYFAIIFLNKADLGFFARTRRLPFLFFAA